MQFNLDVKCDGGYIEIYDGVGTHGSPIGVVCGKDNSTGALSSGKVFLIQFVSNDKSDAVSFQTSWFFTGKCTLFY